MMDGGPTWRLWVGTFWQAQEQTSETDLYIEFLRRPAMSAGVYRLAAGDTDPQSPHNEDEIYFVVSGRAHLRAGDERRPVEAGTIAFVPAHEPHAFEDIEEDLEILVVFAPAET
jgi:mannose-6-phosphate isomerase-like protein (cupin superfamily)